MLDTAFTLISETFENNPSWKKHYNLLREGSDIVIRLEKSSIFHTTLIHLVSSVTAALNLQIYFSALPVTEIRIHN